MAECRVGESGFRQDSSDSDSDGADGSQVTHGKEISIEQKGRKDALPINRN